MTREQGGNMTRGPGENPSGGTPPSGTPPSVLLHHKQLVMSGKFRFFSVLICQGAGDWYFLSLKKSLSAVNVSELPDGYQIMYNN